MSQCVRIMVISEDDCVRSLLESSLAAEGHQAICVSTSRDAVALLNQDGAVNLVLLDAAKSTAKELLFSPSLLQAISSEKLCVLSEIGDTSWNSLVDKWKITKILIKPLLRWDIEKLVSSSIPAGTTPLEALIDKSSDAGMHVEELGNGSFFLAASPAMKRIYENIRILGPIDHPVLILGESGVGKEIVARMLHKYHARADKKFLNVNCAALPSELLESELFGYEAGAFTGAVKAKPGKFELANKGTILLDEIGEMSPQMQAKLLHVLQDGSFSRLGGRCSTQVDVRVLAATNINMEEAIAAKCFREDLYYRLNAFTITVPSLRDRREEIPLLIEQAIRRRELDLGEEQFRFSSRMIEAAQEYHWPGNLRELRNFVTRTVVLQDEKSAYEELRSKTQPKIPRASDGTPMRRSSDVKIQNAAGMKDVVSGVTQQTEARMIQQALTASGWNRRRAATELNISYRTLLYKIQRHGLSA